jgi:hypothetical protein
MRLLINVVMLVALLLPALLVGGSAWLWWSQLSRPLVFTAVNLLALYSLIGYLVVRQLSGLGISGEPPKQKTSLVDLLVKQAPTDMLLFFSLSAICLWATRWVLSQSQT